MITWAYEESSFTPTARITGDERITVISDYIGKPTQAYNSRGEKVWEAEYDIYGRIRKYTGNKNLFPFRQAGQHEDEQTGLYYNRFRYYDAENGVYISKDPLSIEGGLNVCAYVGDSNSLVDPFGLSECGAKEASQYLKKMGVSRDKRKEIIGSFDISTIKVKTATDSQYGIRFYDDKFAQAQGQYLFESFTPTINRANLALPPKWNDMKFIKQWQIREGKTMITGKAGPQLSEGAQYVGGADQIFVLQPWKYGSLIE